MPRTYSDDLRWRVIYHGEFLGSATEEIARSLFVSHDFVCRMKRLYGNTGTVTRRPLGNRPRTLTGETRDKTYKLLSG